MALALSALVACGYRFDARIIDAADFLPQSRPRLFIIAWDEAAIAHRRGDADLSLTRYLDRLPGPARAAYFPLAFRKPPPSNAGLETIVDPSAPCFSAEETRKLLAMMTARQAAKLSAAREDAARQGAPVYGALFRRMRGGAQRAEARFDRAGCLRTPAGGSSRQILVIARPDGAVDMRRMKGREGARLMGLPDQYRLPASETQALKLAGDGVAVPVVRHIAETILEPMLRASLEPAAAAE